MVKSGVLSRAGFVVLLGLGLAVNVNPARADDNNPLSDLVAAAAQRLEVAEPVAAYKWKTQNPIEDPIRVRDQLAALAAGAAARGIDPDYVTRVFTDQIGATEALEYHRFAQWKLNPSDVPASPPDLSASRAVIDSLNQVMVTQIQLHWDVLHAPECTERLDNAARDVGATRQLDALYQQALAFATRSYCQP